MNEKQRIIVKDLSQRLLGRLKSDIAELEVNEKFRKVAPELNSQPLIKRYFDFSIVYAWEMNLACSMHYVVSEKNIICDAIFEQIRNFLETNQLGGFNLEDYIVDEEEKEYLKRLFAKNKITNVTLSLLWSAILEKRFYEYNNAYTGSFNFFPVAKKFYERILGKEPAGDIDSSFLATHLSGLLTRIFGIRFDEQSQQEIVKFSKMIEVNPTYAKAYYSRALAYFARQEYDKSLQDANKAKQLGYEIDKDFSEALNKALKGEE